MSQTDYRARLQPKSFTGPGAIEVLGEENDPANILGPLWKTRGVMFPYTPSITTGNVAEYSSESFVHTNYGYSAYIRSYPKPINMTAEFTAHTTSEALYLLAVIHFFRAVTKTYFGISPYKKAGTPPPVLNFSYLGEYLFNKVPVLVKSFECNYEANIDYVPIDTSKYSGKTAGNVLEGTNEGYSYIPTHMTMNIELDTQYVPIRMRNEFNLDDFRKGKLMKGYI